MQLVFFTLEAIILNIRAYYFIFLDFIFFDLFRKNIFHKTNCFDLIQKGFKYLEHLDHADFNEFGH